MYFNRTKKLLKSNHVKFLLAIEVSILAHLFLLGGIDIYNPFFLKDSDSLNIVIVSHLESPLKNDQPVSRKKSNAPKKSIKGHIKQRLKTVVARIDIFQLQHHAS